MDDPPDGRVDICASAFAGKILGVGDDVKLERLQYTKQHRPSTKTLQAIELQHA